VKSQGARCKWREVIR